MYKSNIKTVFIILCYAKLIELGRTTVNCQTSTHKPGVGIDKNIIISSKLQQALEGCKGKTISGLGKSACKKQKNQKKH